MGIQIFAAFQIRSFDTTRSKIRKKSTFLTFLQLNWTFTCVCTIYADFDLIQLQKLIATVATSKTRAELANLSVQAAQRHESQKRTAKNQPNDQRL